MHTSSCCCRGDSFRKEFYNIGEVRSLLPKGVHIMALTATATKTTSEEICKILGMNDAIIIAESPDKPSYEVQCYMKPWPYRRNIQSTY